VQLTEDSWRALARSSPWRWRTLHFTRTDASGSVEAWVRRPGQLLVRDGKGRTTYESGVPYSSSVLAAAVPRRLWRRAAVPEISRDVLPQEVQPALREDGLVDVRPDRGVSYDDPMYQSYEWVAMLDPVELSHHTEVDELRAETVGGREAWRATVRAVDGYDPRCFCCALLWSEVSERLDCEAGGEAYVPSGPYPDAYDVALDLHTGVVTELRPIGAEDSDDLWFTVTIHEVDVSMDQVFAGYRAPYVAK